MRRIMVPMYLLTWIEVDLDSEEVTSLHASDYVENYDMRPVVPDDSMVEDERESFSTPRGLVNLDDFPERDMATDEETIQAGRIIAGDAEWPKLRIEDSFRYSESAFASARRPE